jgi:hypothetical protein
LNEFSASFHETDSELVVVDEYSTPPPRLEEDAEDDVPDVPVPPPPLPPLSNLPD